MGQATLIPFTLSKVCPYFYLEGNIMKFMITKKECQAIINKRMPIVCSGCGGEIEPIQTVDNADSPTHWSGCKKCMCFDSGVKPIIYKIAKKLVEERYFIYYGHLEKPDKNKQSEEYKRWITSQVRGTAGIVEQILNLNKELSNTEREKKI